MDGAGGVDHRRGGDRHQPRGGLDRVPRGRRELGHRGTEPRLRRHGREHRIPGHRTNSDQGHGRRSMAGARMDRRARVDGEHPVHRHAHAVQSGPRLRCVGQSTIGRCLVSVPRARRRRLRISGLPDPGSHRGTSWPLLRRPAREDSAGGHRAKRRELRYDASGAGSAATSAG